MVRHTLSLENAFLMLLGFLAAQGILVAILTWIKYNNSAAKHLALVTILYSLMLVLSIFHFGESAYLVPSYLLMPVMFTFLIGPLFLGLIHGNELSDTFRSPFIYHFIPFIIGYGWLLSGSFLYNLVLVQAAHLLMYNWWVYFEIRKKREVTLMKWAWLCFLGFSVFYIVDDLLLLFLQKNNFIDYVTVLITSAFIYLLSVKSYFNVELQKQVRESKLLSTSMIDAVQKRIHEHLMISHNYLNGDYKLQDLSEELGLSPHQVSEALNIGGDGFYDVINKYRIQEAKKNLIDSGKSAIEIAYACGFNNKVSFYKAFRKYTGHTPRQWRIQNKAS